MMTTTSVHGGAPRARRPRTACLAALAVALLVTGAPAQWGGTTLTPDQDRSAGEAEAATSTAGDLLWDDLVNGAFEDDAKAVTVHGGRVIAVGSLFESLRLERDWHVRAYVAKNGALLWDHTFDVAGEADQARAVVARGHSAFVVGFVTDAEENRDAKIVAYDLVTGDVLWEATLDVADGSDDFVGVGVKGNVVVAAGDTRNTEGELDWLVVGYDAQTGALLWEDVFDGAGDNDTVAERPIAFTGTKVHVVGEVGVGGDDDDALIRTYDLASGALLWHDQYDLAGEPDEFRSVVAHGNRVFAVGNAEDAIGDNQALIRAYDATSGALLWDDLVNLAVGAFNSFDFFNVVVASGSRIIAAGTTDDETGSNDVLMRAYHATQGTTLWELVHDGFGGGTNDSMDAGVAHAGMAFFVGDPRPPGNTDDDWGILAVDADTGEVLWEVLHDQAFDSDFVDDGYAIAAGGGRVFVAGRVSVDVGFEDWLVQAYDAK